MIRQLFICNLAIIGLLAIGAPAQAATISWNADNNSTVGGDGAGSLPPLSEMAGVALAGGWTNDFPDYNYTDLRDDAGNATTTDIVPFNPSGTWAIAFAHPGQDADLSWNKEMINGYLNAGNGDTSGVEITDIPYATYDIIAYFSSDNDSREGSVTDGTSTFYFNTIGAATTAGGNALLSLATDTVDDAADPDANYAIFAGLSGTSQTISVNIPEFGGLAGFQIVDTTIPEPASIAMCGLFGLAGWLRTRRS